MARPFPLAAVLAVRERNEETEERKLVELARELADTRDALRRIEAELSVTSERRAAEVQRLFDGAHHHASYARYKLLVDARSELLQSVQALMRKRAEQQAVYVAARAARKMLSEIRATQQAAWRTEADTREQKRLNDLFTARSFRR